MMAIFSNFQHPGLFPPPDVDVPQRTPMSGHVALWFQTWAPEADLMGEAGSALH